MAPSGSDDDSSASFGGLRALFLNCTLKRSPELSHTQGLVDIVAAVMQSNGVETEVHRPVDYTLAAGVQPDMTEHGWERDDWPQLYERVMATDILVLTTPIWLGEKSSVCQALRHERPVLAATRGLRDPAPGRRRVGRGGRARAVVPRSRVGGPDNDFTNRNATFMAWNLMHLARVLRDEGGFPAYGNQRSRWDAGERFGFPDRGSARRT